MAKLVLFNKPFDVLSQFTDDENRKTLADFIPIKGVYPAGRLDRDSEGLLLLTDNGQLQAQISSPKFNKWKTYCVQVDGAITDEAIEQLASGVTLKDGPTKEARAKRIEEPALWPRNPPVRFRANIPTSWIELCISEGRNRQVRRMTAAVGFPTLRLVRQAIDTWSVDDIPLGTYKEIDVEAPQKRANSSNSKRYSKGNGRNDSPRTGSAKHKQSPRKPGNGPGTRTLRTPVKGAKK